MTDGKLTKDKDNSSHFNFSYHGESRHFSLLDVVDDLFALDLNGFVRDDEDVDGFDDDESMINGAFGVEEVGLEDRFNAGRRLVSFTLDAVVESQHSEFPSQLSDIFEYSAIL